MIFHSNPHPALLYGRASEKVAKQTGNGAGILIWLHYSNLSQSDAPAVLSQNDKSDKPPKEKSLSHIDNNKPQKKQRCHRMTTMNRRENSLGCYHRMIKPQRTDLLSDSDKKSPHDTRKEAGRGNKKVLSQNDKTFPEPKHNTQAEIAKAANTLARLKNRYHTLITINRQRQAKRCCHTMTKATSRQSGAEILIWVHVTNLSQAKAGEKVGKSKVSAKPLSICDNDSLGGARRLAPVRRWQICHHLKKRAEPASAILMLPPRL